MRLRMTVVRPGSSPASTEIEVRAAEGATVGQLRPILEAALPGTHARALSVGASALADDDLLGRPPLLDGVEIVVGTPPPEAPTRAAPTRARRAPGLRLEVTSGPDSGTSHPLTAGRHIIGRTDQDIVIRDPDLSRQHVALDVAGTTVLVSDLGSTNGTDLEGVDITDRPVPWTEGRRLRVGSSILELRDGESPAAAMTNDGQGHWLVNRPPRLRAPESRAEIHFPPPVAPRTRLRLPLLALLAPLAVAVPMAMLQHSPTYLLFGLMSPVMMGGNLLSDRMGGRRQARRAAIEWDSDTRATRARLERALAAEEWERRRAHPDAALVLRAVTAPAACLWERRPLDDDFLLLRLGLGEDHPETKVTEAPESEPAPLLTDVPILLPLRAAGVVGVAGGRAAVAGLTRALIAHIATWHSPHDVRIILLADNVDDRSWDWLDRLPHNGIRGDEVPASSTSGAGRLRAHVQGLERVLDQRRAQRPDEFTDPGRAGVAPAVVVLIDGAAAIRSVPGVARILREGPSVGIRALCLDRDPALLPAECRAVVTMASARGASVTEAGRTCRTVRPDQVGPEWIDEFARAIAPLRDATPRTLEATLPDQARLLDLLDLPETNASDPEMLLRAWRSDPHSTRAVVGATELGAYAIDLRRDGPHILVGGTTGSGKSELLQTLIASLAMATAPDRLGFVLVDYKGGSAFAQCAELPHTLGVVTDLDPHLTQRALGSLDAELKRREGLLRAAGARDLDEYQRKAGSAGSPHPVIPRLVLVIDEFRMLAQELPTFIDGMVRLAALGRSLGVHLVLATQRPAGIVTADIAANVNLRIALRVRDVSDSVDVIESPCAAAIEAATPGRAYARSGSEPLALFQTARVTGSAPPPTPPVSVEVVTRGGDIGLPPAVGTPATGSTDIVRIVAATREAARRSGLRPLASPWLPPLPEVITLGDLASPPDGWHTPYAVVDLPSQQAQQTVGWDVEHDSHLLVIGMPRSGRTTLLRTLAGSIARTLTPSQVQMHAIDGGAGGLLALRSLPHAGVVAARDQTARCGRLLERLGEEVAERQSILLASGFGSVPEQHAAVPIEERLPYVVLLLDGWEQLTADWDHVDHGRPTETLHELIREGPAVGLRVVIAGDRALLMSRLAGSVRDKIVLRLADRTDLMMAGVPATASPTQLVPGRGVRLTDHAEVQIALLTDDPSAAGQGAALTEIGADADRRWAERRSRGVRRPFRIEPLPTTIAYAAVAAEARVIGLDRSPDWALIGVGHDEVTPVGLDLACGSALVAGPARSGRTTALLAMANWLADQGEPIAVLPGGSSEVWSRTGAGPLIVLDRDEPAAIRRFLDGEPGARLFVDDAERLVDTESEDVVLQWFKARETGRGSLVVGGITADFAAAFRGLSVVARRPGQGVLLHPTSYADGELLGVRISPGPTNRPVPGRGLLVRAGSPLPIQVATWG